MTLYPRVVPDKRESERDQGPPRERNALIAMPRLRIGYTWQYVSQPRTSVIMGSCFRRNDSGSARRDGLLRWRSQWRP